jgi:hypothetical protein
MQPLYVLLVVAFVWPQVSHAIVPPEFIVTVGSNLLQILGIISLAVFSIYSALAIFIERGYVFAKTYVLPIIVIVNLIAGGVLYFYIKDTDSQLVSLTMETEFLRSKLLLAEEMIRQVKTDTEMPPADIPECGSGSACQDGKRFFSDTYVIVAKDIALELDINRLEIEAESGVFNHYAYLNGTYLGTPVTDYLHFIATTSDSFSFDFLQEFTILKATDLSSRASHAVSLRINDTSQVRFSVPSADADFVTRNSPAYTRTHSIATTTVQSDGNQPVDAHVYIEKTYSNDADNAIFFPGRDALGVRTAQFIFWDTTGNFYLFDDSAVAKPVPQYQPHTWLLMKTNTGLAQKSYRGMYYETLDDAKLGWKLSLPDLDKAEVVLTASEIYKSEDGRLRVGLIGTISDTTGVREIVGVAHIVE